MKTPLNNARVTSQCNVQVRSGHLLHGISTERHKTVLCMQVHFKQGFRTPSIPNRFIIETLDQNILIPSFSYDFWGVNLNHKEQK